MNYGFHGNMEAKPSMAGILIVCVVVIVGAAIYGWLSGGDDSSDPNPPAASPTAQPE